MIKILKILKKIWLHPFGNNMIDGVASVRPNGRDTFLYAEGTHTMSVYAELLMGQPERRMYSRNIGKWLPPFENEEVSLEKQQAILSRMGKYFDTHNISYEIVDTGIAD